MRLNLPSDYSEYEKNMYLESVEFAKKNFMGNEPFFEKLKRQQLVKRVVDNACKLTSYCDSITAFYIPEHVKISLKANGYVVAEFFQEYPEQDLQDALDESWSIPKEIKLEQLLEISNTGNTGIIYNQDPEITIGGCKYIRTLLLHPFIPNCCSLELQASEPCNVYIEINILQPDLRSMLKNNSWVLWSDLCGTVLAKNGWITHFLRDEPTSIDLPIPIVPPIDIPVHDIDKPSPCIIDL